MGSHPTGLRWVGLHILPPLQYTMCNFIIIKLLDFGHMSSMFVQVRSHGQFMDLAGSPVITGIPELLFLRAYSMRSANEKGPAYTGPGSLMAVRSFEFNDAPYRLDFDICLGKQFFDALPVRRTPAADRLAIVFVYICFVHADVASSGSSDHCLSSGGYFILWHFWKGYEVFWHDNLLFKYKVCYKIVKDKAYIFSCENSHCVSKSEF